MFPQTEDFDNPNSQFFHDTYQWTNAYFGTTEKSFETNRRPPVCGVTDEEFPYDEFISMFPERRPAGQLMPFTTRHFIGG